MQIIIASKASQIEKAITLGLKYRSTLGFLPKGAYVEAARQTRLLIAVEEDDVIGYILYGVNRTSSLAYLVHLCVEKKHRGKGIAKELFESFKEKVRKNFLAVRVNCRRDYDVNSMWSKLGFVAVREKEGRGKTGNILDQWRFDFDHPDLLTAREEQKIYVPIDANIFYDLQDAKPGENPLQGTWLKANIEFCVTPELFNEIQRIDNADLRVASRAFAEHFFRLSYKQEVFQKILKEVVGLFPKTERKQHVSDFKHLAGAIAAEADFFISRDRKLLNKHDELYQKFKIKILEPSSFIVLQDEVLRVQEYQPARLAISNANIAKITAEDIPHLDARFRSHKTGESKAVFKKRVTESLSALQTVETKVIKDVNKQLWALFSQKKQNEELTITLLRVESGKLAETVAGCVIGKILTYAVNQNCAVVKISDEYIGEETKLLLYKNGFFYEEGVWVKLLVLGYKSIAEIKADFNSMRKTGAVVATIVKRFLKKIEAPSQEIINELEDKFWPVKLKERQISTYIVPIRPNWAMNLFEEKLSHADLFGGDMKLIFGSENVYYRSAKPNVLTFPARVLWYISNDGIADLRKKSVCAASYIEEVIIDTPKRLFSRFSPLGIYKWKDVLSVAKGNIVSPIMAFRFNRTELFPNPISHQKIQKLWKEQTGKSFNIVSPVKVSDNISYKLYEWGNENV